MSEIVCMAIGIGAGMVIEAWRYRRQLSEQVRAEWHARDRWPR